MEMIPNLPDDLARECLVRVSYSHFPTVAAASKRWRDEIRSPEFSRHRRAVSRRQKLLVFSQSRLDPVQNSRFGLLKRVAAAPVFRLTVLELETGRWSELPPPPGFSDGLPLFCQLVAVGSDLVVVGGVDRETWDVFNSVFVYSFMDATWRKGADMPGPRRSFFGCASDYDRMVFVAGGHDGDKNALSSALVYDVVKDTWTKLPDMAKNRDECKSVFLHGKFHVIGGYETEIQGGFMKSAESFDSITWKWGRVYEDFLKIATCPRTCTAGGIDIEEVYMYHNNHIILWKDDYPWKEVVKLPDDMCNVSLVTAWQEGLMVIGIVGFYGPYLAYVLDFNRYEWTKLESLDEFCGNVQSGCYLEI